MRIFPVISMLALVMAACGGSSDSGQAGAGSAGSNPQARTISTPTSVIRIAPTGCQLTQNIGSEPDTGLDIRALHWIQVVQQDMVDADTRLAASKQVIARVDVTGPDNTQLPAQASLILGSTGGCHAYALTPGTATAPTAVDPLTLSSSYTTSIPAADISDRLTSWQVAIDPTRPGSRAEADRLYQGGTLRVMPATGDRIVLRTISFQGQDGALPASDSLTRLLTRALPQSDFALTAGAAFNASDLSIFTASSVRGIGADAVYTFSFDQMTSVLNKLDDECFTMEKFVSLPASIKCVAVFPPNVEFSDPSGTGTLAGLAVNQSFLVASFTSTDNMLVTSPYQGGWLTGMGELFVHEFMHLMSLGHANCGTSTGLDARLYPDGSIGPNGAGQDAERGFYFANTGSRFNDFMSYCAHTRWTSDLAYRIIMNFKNPSTAQAGAAPSPDPVAYAESAEAGGQARPPRQLIRLAKYEGRWHARTSPRIPGLSRFTAEQDAGFIHSALAGQPVWAPTTHVGQLRNGPLYIPATPEVLSALSSGSLPILFSGPGP